MATIQTNNVNTSDPSGQLSLPLTVSILISESLFLVRNSPVSTLILPFIRVNIPYAYFLIAGLELATALLVKWSSMPTAGYGFSGTNINQEFPDTSSLSQIYNLPQAQSPLQRSLPTSSISTSEVNRNSTEQDVGTPLFPKGLTVNLSFSAPFSEPNSNVATLYTVELLEINKVPGYLVTVVTLILYIILRPYLKPRESNKNL